MHVVFIFKFEIENFYNAIHLSLKLSNLKTYKFHKLKKLNIGSLQLRSDENKTIYEILF